MAEAAVSQRELDLKEREVAAKEKEKSPPKKKSGSFSMAEPHRDRDLRRGHWINFQRHRLRLNNTATKN